jgi:hypothetical protein
MARTKAARASRKKNTAIFQPLEVRVLLSDVRP